MSYVDPEPERDPVNRLFRVPESANDFDPITDPYRVALRARLEAERSSFRFIEPGSAVEPERSVFDRLFTCGSGGSALLRRYVEQGSFALRPPVSDRMLAATDGADSGRVVHAQI